MVRLPDWSAFSRLAIASLLVAVASVLLGAGLLLGWVPQIGLTILIIRFNLATVPAFLAILLAISSLAQIRESGGNLEGRELATTSLIIGITVVFLFLLQRL